ncbi:fimbrial protein [Serratia marcescens]|uniref:fimbrial protein n=1 Tax=Serratia marcescens TaxID=615 RepID=UPI001249D9B7|nr:fimbrial protein [Serratia marcescens]KAB1579658.1 type 1 fimbrial protein [Serratia marcescens]
MKAIFKITALAALMVGTTQMAHAGQNANVEITGTIVTHTCDLSVPQASYDLGNWAAADMTPGTPVGAKQFFLTVKNCQGKLAAKDDLLTIQTNETGKTNNADATKFYGDDAGTNAGITLTMQGGDVNGATPKNVSPSSTTFDIHKAAAAAEDISGKQWPIVVTAAMDVAAGKTATPGALKANLQFTMAE